MKTKNKTRNKFITSLLVLLPLIAIAVMTLYSCGNTKKGEATFDAIAPPPPPPPPPPPVAPVADSVYLNVDEMPVFKGGDTAILNWVGRNTKYPEEAKIKNITGKVIVRFVVGKDGSVSQVAIVESANPLFNAEALRVIGKLPKFEKPAMIKGTPVSVHYMIPIQFNLK